MKNIFKIKVKWFKSEPVKSSLYISIMNKEFIDWTHEYTNTLGDTVYCVIESDDGDYCWIINKNGCEVRLKRTDLRKINW
jgi:hypothetical protein